MRDGVMYVAVRDQVGTRLNVVDPRTLRILFGFGVRGAVRLPGHTTSTDLLLDSASRLVVVTTTIDRGHAGERLHVLRFAADGTPDLAFGGRVRREGRDVLLEQGIDDALVDASGRIVALGGDSTLVRLDAAGELDPTFGDQGVAQLRRSSLCELPPANLSEVCRGA